MFIAVPPGRVLCHGDTPVHTPLFGEAAELAFRSQWIRNALHEHYKLLEGLGNLPDDVSWAITQNHAKDKPNNKRGHHKYDCDFHMP